MLHFTKKVAEGTYPSLNVAKMGSFAGILIGILVVIVGIIGIVTGQIWGVGSLLVGIVMIFSNTFNLRRIIKQE